MSNNTTLPGTGEVVEDLDIGAGVKRQVMSISPRDLSTGDSIGALTETAPASDTASSGLNGRLQRIAQRLTSTIALLPAALGSGGGLKVDGSGTALPVSGTVTANAGTNLNTSALALDATLSTTNTEIGIVTETAPASDTASSGLNGRLQRIAQRLTSIIALLPTALGANGGLKIEGVASGTVVPVSDGAGSLTVDNAGTFATQSAITAASGAIASGAVASGAIASGAVASGAFASGSIAAGAIAAGATSIAENEDVASADGDRGIKVLFKRLDSPANSSGTSGDYEQPQMSAGRIWASATIDAALPAGTNAIGKLSANSGVNIGDVDVTSVPADPFGVNADAASATGSISAKLRGIATALGVTAFDLGSGTGGTRTLRSFLDTAQWVGGAGAVTSATQRTTLASDDPAVAALGATGDAAVTAGATGSISAKLRSISRDIVANIVLAAGTAIIGKVGIDQTTVGTTDSVTVKTQGYKSAQSVTRPANVTAYTANDVLGATAAAITFSNIAPAAGEILITSAELEINVSAVPSGMTSFRLYLYNVTPPGALADNAAFDLPSGDRTAFVGYVDLGSPADLGSTLYCRVDAINAQFTATGTSLFGYLVTNGAFTPAGNSEVYKVTLHSVMV